MRKVFILLLTLISSLFLSVPSFAQTVETPNGYIEIPDGTTLVGYDITYNESGLPYFVYDEFLVGDPKTCMDNLPDGALVLGTASDGLPIFTTSLDSLTYTIAEEGDVTLTLTNGVTIALCEKLLEVWDSYENIVCYKYTGKYQFLLFNGDYTFSGDADSWYIKVQDIPGKIVNNSENTIGGLGAAKVTSADGGFSIQWANFDIKDSAGNLIRASDVPVEDEVEELDLADYTVSFEVGVGGYPIEPYSALEVVEWGAPIPSAYDGFVFEGWYLDAGYTEPYSIFYTFTGDTVLYAKWMQQEVGDTSQEYTISFVTNHEDLNYSPVSSIGFVAPYPDMPNYLFGGWYFDEDFTLPYYDGYLFVRDTTLYAKWQRWVSVNFYDETGNAIGGSGGYTGDPFESTFFWHGLGLYSSVYTDLECTQPYIEGSILTGDLNLYLKFGELGSGDSDSDTDSVQPNEEVMELLEHVKGLDILQSQLWIILVVGLLFFVYKLFRMFF